jgi:transcriptional regulator with XRE-family HTH domain
MHTRASQALAKAFEDRGAQARLAERTGISPTRLSRLADGDTFPNLQTSLKLKDDPEVPIDPSWWTQPVKVRGAAKGAA